MHEVSQTRALNGHRLIAPRPAFKNTRPSASDPSSWPGAGGYNTENPRHCGVALDNYGRKPF